MKKEQWTEGFRQFSIFAWIVDYLDSNFEIEIV